MWLSRCIKPVCIISRLTACNYANGLAAFGHTIGLLAPPVNVCTLLCAFKTIGYVTGQLSSVSSHARTRAHTHTSVRLLLGGLKGHQVHGIVWRGISTRRRLRFIKHVCGLSV